MNIREALTRDIKQIQIVRNSVFENALSDPNLVTDNDCAEFISIRGKGWVYEIENCIVGFSIVDLKENNFWVLFLNPEFEKRGIGKMLHDVVIDWYFTKTKETIWLGTAPNTRAENFYRKAGWMEVGLHGKNEIKFEMTFAKWIYMQKSKSSID